MIDPYLIIVWLVGVLGLTSPFLLFWGLYALRNRGFKRVSREFGLKCEIYGKWLQDQDLGEIREVSSIFWAVSQERGKDIRHGRKTGFELELARSRYLTSFGFTDRHKGSHAKINTIFY